MRRFIFFISSFLLCFCCGCYALGPDNEIIEYIVDKENGKLKPVGKLTYKVFIDKQEVVYWVETLDGKRSQLHKLKNCIVADKNNWVGYTHPDSLFFKGKVEFVNGKILGSDNVSWWTWHFKTEPRPSNLSIIVGGIMALLMVCGTIAGIRSWWLERKKKQNET